MKKMMQLLMTVGLFALSGTLYAVDVDVSGRGSIDIGNGSVDISVGSGGDGSRHEHAGGHSKGQPDIPPGHMPARGECRIWYHGRAPGQQPAPGKCRNFRGKVPAGASLIRG